MCRRLRRPHRGHARTAGQAVGQAFPEDSLRTQAPRQGAAERKRRLRKRQCQDAPCSTPHGLPCRALRPVPSARPRKRKSRMSCSCRIHSPTGNDRASSFETSYGLSPGPSLVGRGGNYFACPSHALPPRYLLPSLQGRGWGWVWLLRRPSPRPGLRPPRPLKGWGVEIPPSTIKLPPSSFHHQASTIKLPPSPSTFHPPPSTFHLQ